MTDVNVNALCFSGPLPAGRGCCVQGRLCGAGGTAPQKDVQSTLFAEMVRSMQRTVSSVEADVEDAALSCRSGLGAELLDAHLAQLLALRLTDALNSAGHGSSTGHPYPKMA